MRRHFPKMKAQVISYRKYKDFRKETFLDSLRHELNVQGQFLIERGLNALSTICTEILYKHANIYFANKEISVFYFCKNLKRIISKT